MNALPRGDVWDAVVVGAGPAGAVTARELARGGATVLLVEKAVFPRQKVCGCCLNPAALATLAAIGLGDLPARLGAVPLRQVRLAAGKRSAELPLAGVALSREAFDLTLRDAARDAGVVVRHGVRARLGSWSEVGRQVHLESAEGSQVVRARVVVAANGLAGRLDPHDAAFESLARPGSRVGAGVVVEARHAPTFYEPGRVDMAVGRGGYVGLVRLEDGRLDLAASLDADFLRDSHGIGRAVERLLHSVGWPTPADREGLPWKGTPALTRRPRRVAGPGWFAVGDAAGYIEPFTGEGMAWAVQSAVALAPLALRTMPGWHESHATAWATRHARLLGGPQRTCRAVARVLRSPRATGLAVRLLSAFPTLARPVLARLQRSTFSLQEPFA